MNCIWVNLACNVKRLATKIQIQSEKKLQARQCVVELDESSLLLWFEEEKFSKFCLCNKSNIFIEIKWPRRHEHQHIKISGLKVDFGWPTTSIIEHFRHAAGGGKISYRKIHVSRQGDFKVIKFNVWQMLRALIDSRIVCVSCVCSVCAVDGTSHEKIRAHKWWWR